MHKKTTRYRQTFAYKGYVLRYWTEIANDPGQARIERLVDKYEATLGLRVSVKATLVDWEKLLEFLNRNLSQQDHNEVYQLLEAADIITYSRQKSWEIMSPQGQSLNPRAGSTLIFFPNGSDAIEYANKALRNLNENWEIVLHQVVLNKKDVLLISDI